MTPSDLSAAVDAVKGWHEQTVVPLRMARRGMKAFAEASGLRAQVKEVELKAEQFEHAMLFALSERLFASDGNAPAMKAVSKNVEMYLHGQDRTGASPSAPEAVVRVLLSAIGTLDSALTA